MAKINVNPNPTYPTDNDYPGTMHCAKTGNILAYTNEIQDAAMNLKQEKINQVFNNDIDEIRQKLNRETSSTPNIGNTINLSNATKLVVVNITSDNQTLQVTGKLEAGREVQVIIKNTSGQDISLNMPTNITNITDAKIYIAKDKYGEANFVADANNTYLRAVGTGIITDNSSVDLTELKARVTALENELKGINILVDTTLTNAYTE